MSYKYPIIFAFCLAPYMHLTQILGVLHALLISYHLCIQAKIYMHLTPTLCVLHVLLIFIIYSLSRTLYIHLTPTLCMLHAHLISYHICILPDIPHAFETHTMCAAGDTNIQISIISFQHTRRIGTHTMRAACPTNILSSMPSA